MAISSIHNSLSLEELPISAAHRARLAWFLQHEGKIVPFSRFQDFGEPGLLTKAKGIYKPKGWEYSLSIRQSLASTYGDLPFMTPPEGGWIYRYHRENGENRYTNNGLIRCLMDGIPVGVIVQIRPKPNAEYWIAGLGQIKQFNDPWFDLVQWQSDVDTSQIGRLIAEVPVDYDAPIEALRQLGFLEDSNEERHSKQLVRPNQQLFRAMLLKSYDQTCAVTGSKVVPALEAAHIRPFSYERIDKVENGLLLRADVHRLFDRNLVGVNPTKMETVVSKLLIGTEYEEYAGVELIVPSDQRFRPAVQYLEDHFQQSGIS